MVIDQGDTLTVRYDIVGERLGNVFYQIVLSLSADGGKTFPIQPTSATGDIRYGVSKGYGKTIRWEPLKDGLELVGGEYVFKVAGYLLEKNPPPQFTTLPAGSFVMGDERREGGIDERPAHAVTLDEFELSSTPITNLQFAAFLNEYSSDDVRGGEFGGEPMIVALPAGLRINRFGSWEPDSGYEHHPVIGVTWFGAHEYAKHNGFRLPSEAEWEYAAREGGKSVRYGNGADTCDGRLLNYRASVSSPEMVASFDRSSKSLTTRVTSFPPSRAGLFDMSGNVWEWCQDWYSAEYYWHSPSKNPPGPPLGKYKAIRGGSWYTAAPALRCTERSFLGPCEGRADVGFRVVRRKGQ